jgi:uncharacterized alkaline shock family protein YloU
MLPPSGSGLGRITISKKAVAQIVGHTALECYGVVGISGRGPMGKLLARTSPERGVDATSTERGLAIALDVVVEHGLNLSEVAATLGSRIVYEVERLTGLKVAEDGLRIQIVDVRQSQ